MKQRQVVSELGGHSEGLSVLNVVHLGVDPMVVIVSQPEDACSLCLREVAKTVSHHG